MTTLRQSRLGLYGLGLIGVTCVVVFISIRSKAYENFMPIDDFENVLLDSCKLLDLKLIRKASGNADDNSVPFFVQAMHCLSKNIKGDILQGRAETRRFYSYEFTLQGDDIKLICKASIAGQYIYRIDIITMNGEKERVKGHVLGSVLEKWKAMRSIRPNIVSDEASAHE